MRIALYQPDIPQNTGTILRLAACLGIGVDIIEPTGFALTDRALRRAGMDYLDIAEFTRHLDFDHFEKKRRTDGSRLILLTTHAETAYTDFRFAKTDHLLFGRESAGVPETVHAAADARLAVPIADGLRSLNVAVACAMVVGEALRQTDGFPIRSNIEENEGRQ
ncbi:MAG: tRNA (cytidine(34)-2'-O)-methyltransferase [Hyphomicrobiales bacterium]|nr:tRNA (cytidine(34)-2'-O)-methyltransferase [Hyphomicrobiales bacterium]